MAKGLRFIIVPKVEHPWFQEVHKGALDQATILSRETGIKIEVEYMPPRHCSVTEQNAILEKAASSRPSGIAVDPVDTIHNMPAIRGIRKLEIPVVLFDSPSPDAQIPCIGNNFTQQGVIAAERLAKLLGHVGKVAVMRGYPTAPNHKERYESQLAVLRKYPGITVVDGGVDNDDINTAHQQASAVLESYPDLAGYLCCDAAGPIGIAAAIKEAGKAGKITVVSMDGIKPILDAIQEGVIESSSATIPKMQGSMSLLMLWQASMGVQLPQAIDTGIDLITKENVNSFLPEVAEARSVPR
jgi:ribose transport system substrate-binding protein